MSPRSLPSGYGQALEFPLFSALQGRRSRRFSLGAEIPDGPLKYDSQQDPVPLDLLEQRVILAAVAGNTGWHFLIPWNEASAPDLPRFSNSAGGRTFPSAAGWHTTDFFYTDDTGVFFLSTRDAHPALGAAGESDSSRTPSIDSDRSGARLLRKGRLHLPPVAPHVSPHNRWSFNRPGSLVIFPVSDVAQYLLALLLNYAERGICMFDDVHGCPIPGIEQFRQVVNTDDPAPLSVAEQEALTGCTAEIAMSCYSGALALQAMGLGGWLFDGLNAQSLLGASDDPDVPGLGFHFQRDSRWPQPNPTGVPGVFEGHCPPYFPSMRAALQSLTQRRFGPGGPYHPQTEGPWKESGWVRGGATVYPPGVLDCVAWTTQYVYDAFGKFPGTVPTMSVRTFLQAHHLDLAFYDAFFEPGAYLETHASHFAKWHREASLDQDEIHHKAKGENPMTEPESWQISSDAAEIYEKVFVPTLVGQWALQVADAARIRAGDRVLDVGCGTGILAREAIARVGSSGRVTGLDLNEGMLAVAQRIEPDVEWRRGNAVDLPFDDESFDVVVSQFVLMYLPDRIAALREMKRVLAPEGRLAVAVWGPFERATGYVILTEIVKRHGGQAAANLLTAPHALGDEGKLATLFKASGFDNLEISLREGVYAQPSIEHFIEYEVKGTPLDDFFNQESYQALLKEAHRGLSSFVMDGGKVIVPMDAIIVTAQEGG